MTHFERDCWKNDEAYHQAWRDCAWCAVKFILGFSLAFSVTLYLLSLVAPHA